MSRKYVLSLLSDLTHSGALQVQPWSDHYILCHQFTFAIWPQHHAAPEGQRIIALFNYFWVGFALSLMRRPSGRQCHLCPAPHCRTNKISISPLVSFLATWLCILFSVYACSVLNAQRVPFSVSPLILNVHFVSLQAVLLHWSERWSQGGDYLMWETLLSSAVFTIHWWGSEAQARLERSLIHHPATQFLGLFLCVPVQSSVMKLLLIRAV